jgi:hypothetical protein
MKRNGLSVHTQTRIAQKMPANYKAKILQLQKFIIAARKKCFGPWEIGSMDELPLTFNVPSNKTEGIKGGKSIMIKTSGHQKIHYNVVLVCCTDGTNCLHC